MQVAEAIVPRLVRYWGLREMSPSAHLLLGQPQFGSSAQPPSGSPVPDCSTVGERPAGTRTVRAREPPARSGDTAVTECARPVPRPAAQSASRPDSRLA